MSAMSFRPPASSTERLKWASPPVARSSSASAASPTTGATSRIAMRAPPGDAAGRRERRHGGAGDHGRHGADVGAEAAPGQREREHSPSHRESPHARARRRGRQRPAQPEQPDDREGDLDLVAGAEEARSQHGVRTQQRAAQVIRSEREVGDMQADRDRGRHDERPVPRPDAVRRQRERGTRPRHDQRLDRGRRRDAGGHEQHARQPHRREQQRAPRQARVAPRDSRRLRRSASAPIRPSQITPQRRGPRSVRRLRSSDRSAGLASPRASIGLPDMSSGTSTPSCSARSARRRWS